METTFGKQINSWLSIGGALSALATTCVLIGIYISTIKDLPKKLDDAKEESNRQFSIILSQFGDYKNKNQEQDWEIASLKTKTDALGSQILLAADDRGKIWEISRKNETKIAQLDSSKIDRETFIEWKAALENRNRNISAPPLSKQQ